MTGFCEEQHRCKANEFRFVITCPSWSESNVTGSLDTVLKLSLVVFMVGSLFGMGLGLKAKDAMSSLRNLRFVGYSLFFGFVAGPLLALVLTRVLPLSEPYAIGLLLLSLTPSAPFLPVMVARAGGEMNYAASMLILASVGAVLLLPVAVPYITKGLSVSAWAIARPLVALVLVPLVAGMLVLRAVPAVAVAVRPAVRVVTTVATVVMLALCAILYGQDFFDAVGSFAILAQLVFLTCMTVAGYLLCRGLPATQRSVIGLGLSTRNAGAALAPLMTMAGSDRRSIVMVVLAVPVQIIVSLIAANLFRRRAASVSVQQGVSS